MAAPLDSAPAASSLRGGASTEEGTWASGSLEEEIYKSKMREGKLEAALKDAKARLVDEEAWGAQLKQLGEWLEHWRLFDPPEDLRPETPSPNEPQVRSYTSTGSHLPIPAWVDGHFAPGLPQAHRPRLEDRLQPRQQTIAEGEVLRVCWPADASIDMFGAPHTKHCWADLVKEATKLDMLLKMRGPRAVKKRQRENTGHPSQKSGGNNLSIAGPRGTTRDFYAELRTIMACKRQSWTGLRPPRKVTVYLIQDSIMQGEVPLTSAAASGSAAGRSEEFQDGADDTDDGEPPCEEGLQFIKLAALAAGHELAVPTKEIVNEQQPGSHFQSQDAQMDPETAQSFRQLIVVARHHLEVVVLHGCIKRAELPVYAADWIGQFSVEALLN